MTQTGDQSPSVDIPGVVVHEVQHAVTAGVPVPPVEPALATWVSSAPSVSDAAPIVDEPAVDASVSDTEPVAEPAVDASVPDIAPVVDEPAVVVEVEKKKPAPRSGGMAAGGQAVEAPGPPPPTPGWPDLRNHDEMYVPEEFDASDLSEANKEMNKARARLFRVSQMLKTMQRTLAEAQLEYDRAMRRELVTITGGTSESRRAMAEIRCEHFENRVVVGKQVVEEWRKRSMDCRDDIKAIENMSHNIRAQVGVQ